MDRIILAGSLEDDVQDWQFAYLHAIARIDAMIDESQSRAASKPLRSKRLSAYVKALQEAKKVLLDEMPDGSGI